MIILLKNIYIKNIEYKYNIKCKDSFSGLLSLFVLYFHASTNPENIDMDCAQIYLQQTVQTNVKENRLGTLHFYLCRISLNSNIRVCQCFQLVSAFAHGCQVGITWSENVCILKALIGGFNLLTSGNLIHESLWRLVTNAR